MVKVMELILFLVECVLVSSSAFNTTVECERSDDERTVRARAGEALYLPCPNVFCDLGIKNRFQWFRTYSRRKKRGTELNQISSEEGERVHHHDSVLYILDLKLSDTGLYITRMWTKENVCVEFETKLEVFEAFSRDLLYYIPPMQKVSGIYCPICEKQKGAFTWFKDFSLIRNQTSSRVLRIPNASKESQGIYTCLCTWEHNGIQYNSSGHRELIIEDQTKRIPPVIRLPVNNSIIFTDVGAELNLSCSVLFGTEVCFRCFVYWRKNNIRLEGKNGYEQIYSEIEGLAESVLTISSVSEEDLNSQFHCKAEDEFEVFFTSVTLKKRESMRPVILLCVFVLLFLLMFGATIQCFALDLQLFFKEIHSKFCTKEDGKLYDAYVIYQRSGSEDAESRSVSEFVNGPLLRVLEDHCRFKLFICGRDDLPGEDSINLSEQQIQLSRRLLIILSSGSSIAERSYVPEAFDMSLGLHQALIEGSMPSIVLQLGRKQDYTHLPLGLQHLLCKSSALLWRDGESSPNSRFWKRVRYRMPAPSKSSLQKKSMRNSLI